MSDVQAMPEGESQSSQYAEPATRPGLLLRQAREARCLSVDDVVQVLKFSHRQIEAIEADDLESLPGMVFVRGSIRSYARLLKLDPQPLLSMLDQDAPASLPDVRPPDNMGNAMPKGGMRQIPSLVALSILLLIIAAGMVAWHFFGERLMAPMAAMPAVAESDATPAAVAASATEAVQAPQPVVQSASAVPVVEAVQATPGMPADTPSTQVPPSAGPRQLIFGFHGKSWVEVKDASQQIVFTGQFGDGARQAVSGQPPFQIVVGNAAVVDLQFDDRSIDLKPYTRAEVARLTLE